MQRSTEMNTENLVIKKSSMKNIPSQVLNCIKKIVRKDAASCFPVPTAFIELVLYKIFERCSIT